MKDENRLYWIWLSEKCGIASKEFGRLMERYCDPFDLYRLDEDEIEQLDGIGKALKRRLNDKSLESAYSILRYCKTHRVTIVAYGDESYPARLRNIEDPPVLLYTLGKLPDLNHRLCIGMVGTRKMSEYGRQTAYKISYELAASNAVVVSGMAEGIDGVSACGAMASGGETVAVLGCGISRAYPKEHERLMKEIAKHGAVITEYPPSERPLRENFPRRNRIISGLCQGVLIVEGPVGSGALITAKFAVDQGREVFALPGKVNEKNSYAPNELIRQGANVALSSEDILRHYDFLYHDMINYRGLARSKAHMVEEETALRRYGVSALYEIKKNKEKKASVPKTNPTVASKESTSHRPVLETQMSKTESSQGRPDASEPVLAALDDVTKQVFASLPMDCAVSPDGIALEGVSIGEVITALTLLELSGLVTSLPGRLYQRK